MAATKGPSQGGPMLVEQRKPATDCARRPARGVCAEPRYPAQRGNQPMTERDPEPGQAERPERAFRHFVRGTAPPDSPAYQQPGVVSVGQPRQPSPTEPTPPSQEQRKMRDIL